MNTQEQGQPTGGNKRWRNYQNKKGPDHSVQPFAAKSLSHILLQDLTARPRSILLARAFS